MHSVTGIRGKSSKRRFAPTLLAAAGLAVAIPSTGLAVAGDSTAELAQAEIGFIPFTPANIDADLLRDVSAALGTEGLRFTPVTRKQPAERTVTMAVRVDPQSARAISIRNALESAGETEPGLGTSAPIVQPMRYNLGVARGYQTFAQPAPKALDLPAGIRDISMPDLGAFRSAEAKPDKPSRFTSRIQLEREKVTGRAPRTLEGAGDQSVDVSGSYRVLGNLNVTAGVRLSQDRNRLAPLTDGVEDSQAVYVGTQFRF